MDETWDRILLNKFKDCKYGFFSVELGCEIYEGRDPLNLVIDEDYYVIIDIDKSDKYIPNVFKEICYEDGEEEYYETFWDADKIKDFITRLLNLDMNEDLPIYKLIYFYRDWCNKFKGNSSVRIKLIDRKD